MLRLYRCLPQRCELKSVEMTPDKSGVTALPSPRKTRIETHVGDIYVAPTKCRLPPETWVETHVGTAAPCPYNPLSPKATSPQILNGFGGRDVMPAVLQGGRGLERYRRLWYGKF